MYGVKSKAIIDLLKGNKRIELPDALEVLVGHSGHFDKVYVAKKFFGLRSNINSAIEAKVSELFR